MPLPPSLNGYASASVSAPAQPCTRSKAQPCISVQNLEKTTKLTTLKTRDAEHWPITSSAIRTIPRSLDSKTNVLTTASMKNVCLISAIPCRPSPSGMSNQSPHCYTSQRTHQAVIPKTNPPAVCSLPSFGCFNVLSPATVVRIIGKAEP